MMKFLLAIAAIFTGPPAAKRRLALPQIESLGERVNPSVVTVSLDPTTATLSLAGDAASNVVQVFRTGETVTVTGQAGTTVRGPSSVAGVRNFTASLGDGDDSLSLFSGGGAALGALTINGRRGYDSVTAANVRVTGATTILLGSGDDTLSLTGVSRTIDVDGGVGNNDVTLQISAGTIDTLRIDSPDRASSGRDRVTIRGAGAATTVNDLVVRTGAQNDTITVGSLAASRIYVHGGAGDDRLVLTSIILFGQRRIDIDGVEFVN